MRSSCNASYYPLTVTYHVSYAFIVTTQLGTKGDMRVRFKIVFPDMSEAERQQIGTIIRNAHYGSSSGAKQARK
jgi:hypothetical protein